MFAVEEKAFRDLYTVTRVLGSGGSGKVFAATRIPDGALVSINSTALISVVSTSSECMVGFLWFLTFPLFLCSVGGREEAPQEKGVLVG